MVQYMLNCEYWLSSSQSVYHHNHKHINEFQCVYLVVFLLILIPVHCENERISIPNVHGWAHRFGKDIYEGSADATCLRKIQNNYVDMKASASNVGCDDQVRSMAEMVSNMFGWKKNAAHKIATKAEREAQNANPYVPGEDDEYNYLNAKTFTNGSLTDESGQRYANLVPSSTFRNIEVDPNNTAVHIPTNVWEKKQDMETTKRWSGALWSTFHSNSQNDTELNWQFFCSSKGLLRYYPAARWRYPKFLLESENELDLYDCRMREWYVKAAASPKDIVILLDGSGSMTGERKAMARSVVNNILDTLTDDDYVTVIRFSDELESTVPCFDQQLVEANRQNINLFKASLVDLSTSEIANFSIALTRAFEILQAVNRSGQGTQCNQAIMLVTDGAPDTFKEIFDKFNHPRISIRVFTYLVGKEVTETQEVKLMACQNRGYYTQVSSLSEIREQVQLYLPVMSRPLILSGHRVFRFTGVYADITDVPLTPWVWDERERERAREEHRRRLEKREAEMLSTNAEHQQSTDHEDDQASSPSHSENEQDSDSQSNNEAEEAELGRKNSESVTSTSKSANYRLDHQYVDVPKSQSHRDQEKGKHRSRSKSRSKRHLPFDPPGMPSFSHENQEKKTVHELMTTLSLPVFDVKNTTNITERFLVKNVWRTRTKEVRSANLLGIVGIDIPIREIVRRTPAYKIGVNGYAFAINNNGHILFHPDLRPLFQDLLKPFYSSVDLLEVEIPNSTDKPRDYHKALLEFRNAMIRSNAARLPDFEVKMHIDSMKRAVTRRNSYCSQPIAGTPFSLALSLPQPYGGFRVTGELEIKRRDENFTHYFRGNNWRVHPDWVYCDNEKFKRDNFSTPEGSVLHFLSLAAANETNIWYLEPSRLPPVKSRTTCEKELVKSLVFDAKATDIDAKNCGINPNIGIRNEKKIAEMFGVTLTFVATRSGLTRFEDHRSPEQKEENSDYPDPETDFIETHNKAIDELYYQRAVDFHRFNSTAFLFSVPFNSGTRNTSAETRSDRHPIYVTGSHAIFVGQGKQKAPAAVVGLLARQQIFAERFFNFSERCGAEDCKVNCRSENIDCYLLDNSGFVIASEAEVYADDLSNVGRFFGEIDDKLFREFVDKGIYREVKMFDYQAMCIEIIQPSGPGVRLLSPLDLIRRLVIWFWSKLSMVLFELYLGHYDKLISGNTYTLDSISFNEVIMDSQNITKFKSDRPIKTQPYPCDKMVLIYEGNFSSSDRSVSDVYSKCAECQLEYVVQPVPRTNLLIVVVESECASGCTPTRRKIQPYEIKYPPESCIYERRRVNLTRQRPDAKDCRNFHPEEEQLKQCGSGVALVPYHPLVAILVIMILHLLCIR
ncbi:voltage-dependent calcium channel subunit alpha-2/delta-3-like isoform X2 [Brevipalpus obovatus]|uniref:voltage-dependent calcium channel subunit alpha-2/delta-3-like isoform X2 n=1 Tax=Brevipalpus obovatus TaxID=246614 RepID=UPI003D9EE7FC